MSSDYELSIDDLVDLLHSVDHEKVVDSENAVISDEALAALLDRTLQGNRATEEGEDNVKGAGSTAHSGVFKIIAERDSSGKLIGEHSTEDIVCASGTATGGDAGVGVGTAAEIVAGDGGGLDAKCGAGTPEMATPIKMAVVGGDLDSQCGAGEPVATSTNGTLTSDSISITPEPTTSGGSLQSSSSVSIGSSSGYDSIQSMDADASTPAMTGSSSPIPEPTAGGVVVSNTEVKVCTGRMEIDDKTVSSDTTGSLMTS